MFVPSPRVIMATGEESWACVCILSFRVTIRHCPPLALSLPCSGLCDHWPCLHPAQGITGISTSPTVLPKPEK